MSSITRLSQGRAFSSLPSSALLSFSPSSSTVIPLTSPHRALLQTERLNWPQYFNQTRYFTQNLIRPFQIYRSASSDPYVNLSIEHHLLQSSPPDSTILFLYTNRPSIVIGRNQNPWLEVNLRLLRDGLPTSESQDKKQPIALVRRRSGGGTVFHDKGNTNYSVICPPAVFDRDRHAEMVARALRKLGVPHRTCGSRPGGGVRVNERHDIVVDILSPSGGMFKISGSAYKLTRTRALHHGTCLLSSPNLGSVSALLRSPAEGFIKARGVESVRSPIRNVNVGTEEFVDAVVDEFCDMYGVEDGGKEVLVIREEEALATEGINKGVRELTDPEWIFGQTPLFTFSTHPTEDDPRDRPPSLLAQLPHDFQGRITVRHGEIQSVYLSLSDDPFNMTDPSPLSQVLAKERLHHISDWRAVLSKAVSEAPLSDAFDVEQVGMWLNRMFGIPEPVEGQKERSLSEEVVRAIQESKLGMWLSK